MITGSRYIRPVRTATGCFMDLMATRFNSPAVRHSWSMKINSIRPGE